MIHIFESQCVDNFAASEISDVPKLSFPQKSVSSLANRNMKNNCCRDMIESALELPENVLSNAL